jgi:two-component SAPR family response regulator
MAYLWLQRALRLTPDMIVANITMPVMHGIDPVGKLYKSGSNSKLVFLPPFARGVRKSMSRRGRTLDTFGNPV